MVADELRQIVREELHAARLPSVPIRLQEAAEVCHCEYRWLLDKVQSGEIRGYRPAGGREWRVFVADVVKYLTAECSAKPKRHLRAAA